MDSRLRLGWAAAALIVLAAGWGCTNTAAKPGEGSEGKGKEGTSTEAPKVVGENLKTEAFNWMGFDREDTYNYLVSEMEGVDAQPGTQTLALVSTSENAAKFQFTRAGSMEKLGSEDFEARKDGIYQTRMSLGALAEPMLVMPGDVKTGSSWPSTFETTDSNGRKIVFKVTNKAEKEESVKVKAGDYNALLVTTTGTMTVTEPAAEGAAPAKPVVNQLSSKAWYAKGIGNVKMTLEVKRPDNSSVRSSVELESIGAKPADSPAPSTPAKP